MNKDQIIKKCDEVRKMIYSSDLADPIILLSDIAEKTGNFSIREELSRLRETYRYMTDYMIRGVEDPTRGDVRDDIAESLLCITDRITVDAVTSDASDSYSEAVRMSKLRPESMESLLSEYAAVHSELTLAESAGNDFSDARRRLEFLHERIFNTLWTSLNDRRTITLAVDAVKSEKYGDDLAPHIISALTLSLTGFFDRFKLLGLLDIYAAEISDRLTARALVGIVFALSRHGRRATHSKEIRDRLEAMQDSLLSYSRFRETVMAIIRTRDTDRVSNKMKEEVIPELMKLQPDILKKMREASSDPESLAGENNPEWEELLDKSGLTDKMRELSEMQSDGADLMMVAFSNLKQFSFFNSVSNWFIPFSAYSTAITGNDNDRNLLLRMMEISRGVCDSDKYSLALALQRMPRIQKDMMTQQLDAQFAQLSEQLEEARLRSSAPEFDEEITKVVRDLYRFFRLFRKKEGFNDPFAEPFNFIDLPVIGEMMGDSEIVDLVAEFYFKRGYYKEALALFNELLERADESDRDKDATAALWEKAGFCYQSFRFYEDAKKCYSKSELLKTPSIWLLKKLAFVNKKLSLFDTALEYYVRVLDGDPENVSLLTNAGYCALEAGRPEESLRYYYHANYLNPDDDRLTRAIAWCELLKGDKEKSLSYYEKILAKKPTPSDWLNAGHAYLSSGYMVKAIECYRKASGGDVDAFEKAFRSDFQYLEKIGVPRLTANIILDMIKLEDN